jgi:hypothetical protein
LPLSPATVRGRHTSTSANSPTNTSVPLPGPYEPTEIRTQIRDGVLEIRVPKPTISDLTAEFTVEEQPNLHGSTCPQRVRGRSLAAERRRRTKVAPRCKTRRRATTAEAF